MLKGSSKSMQWFDIQRSSHKKCAKLIRFWWKFVNKQEREREKVIFNFNRYISFFTIFNHVIREIDIDIKKNLVENKIYRTAEKYDFLVHKGSVQQ